MPSENPSQRPDFISILQQSGETARLISAYDWSTTSLGAIDTWPSHVRSTVLLILRSPAPMVTLWGRDGVLIYNDRYGEFAGSRHPQLLGENVLDAWPEATDLNRHVIDACFNGDTVSYREQELTLYRLGEPDQAWLNLDYSPILDDCGQPAGVLAIVVEVTGKVLGDRWQSGEHERIRQMFEQAPGFIAILNGPEHVFEIVNPAYMQLVGHRDVLGKSIREALPEIEGQGFVELLDKVYASGEPFVGNAMRAGVQRSPGAALEEVYLDLAYQPIKDRKGDVTGIFAQGTDITARLRAEAASRNRSARSRQILDSAIDYAIIAFDTEGKVTRWNRGAEIVFGWTEQEMLGEDAARIFTPEDQDISRIETEMGLSLKRGAANDERWHIRKNAERFWASGEMSPLIDDEGRPAGFVKVLRDQTAEYQAAQRLAQLESRLRRAQEAGGIGLFSAEAGDPMLEVTPEFCRIFGIPPMDRIAASDIEAIVLEEDRALVSNSKSRSNKSALLNVEYRIRRGGSGEIRVISRKGEFEEDADGAPLRMVGAVQDVTERYEFDRAMRESEERFKAFAQAVPNHVWTSDTHGFLDWFNDRVYSFSGATQQELTGHGWAHIVHPDDRNETRRRWIHALASGDIYEAELRLRRADGVYRWYIARAVPQFDGQGKIRRWIGANTDIDDLKSAREALSLLTQDLERQVQARTADRNRMWRLATDIMLVVQMDGKVLSANPALTSALGWSEHNFVGHSVLDFVHMDDLEDTQSEMGRLALGITTLRFVNRFKAMDGGYKTISWTAVPEGNLIHAVGRDVTSEQAAAEQLRQTELALQQSQKMETIGHLTGGVAHDFNNLLQVISGNLQLLSKDVAGNAHAERRLGNALTGVNRGATLASQLLSFGRRQPLEPKVVNIGRFVFGMDDMLRRSLGETVEIETIISPSLWNARIDPAQVENALLNLAINARDAMDGAGKLTIEVGNAVLDPFYASHNPEVKAGEYVLVTVTDTGSGMPPDVVAKVFEPFFSTKAPGKGTGLGLSMVYGFVKQSGGHIKIYSELGEGTSIKLFLPRDAGNEEQVREPLSGSIVGGAETILVAEDDEAVRDIVVALLGELGYKVLTARDAASALSVVESGVHIDMLFTDVVMPGSLKSPELARLVRERQPHVAVLFTSGYTENSIVHDGRLDAGVHLLSKPYTREALARKIRDLLHNHAEAQRSQAPVAIKDPAMRQKLRVLLVEDEVLILMDTADIIRDFGHDVHEAQNGEEALAALESGAFDVILTDLGLPGLSGVDLAHQARALYPKVPIVFLTGEPRMPDIPGPGKTDLLLKPYDAENLRRKIDAVAYA